MFIISNQHNYDTSAWQEFHLKIYFFSIYNLILSDSQQQIVIIKRTW